MSRSGTSEAFKTGDVDETNLLEGTKLDHPKKLETHVVAVHGILEKCIPPFLERLSSNVVCRLVCKNIMENETHLLAMYLLIILHLTTTPLHCWDREKSSCLSDSLQREWR